MAGKSESLLHSILNVSGYAFLSDLHCGSAAFDDWVKRWILCVPEEDYSLADWNSAAGYILQKPCAFSSVEQAKAAITSAP